MIKADRRKTTVFLLILLLMYSCGSFDKGSGGLSAPSLEGSWRLSDITCGGENTAYDEDRLLQDAESKKAVSEGDILSFFNDGSFTDVKGNGAYQWGEWRLSGSQLTLRPSNGSPQTIQVKLEATANTTTLSLGDSASKSSRQFTRYAAALKDFRADPFYYDNNTWRVKPAAPENQAQLQDRLAGYFRHLAYILKSSKDRKQDIVSFEFSQGPVKIYNGGIGINPLKTIVKPWIDTYYNEADAARAHNMFRRYLYASSYKGAGSGDWITDDYNILLSIYADARAGKFPKDSL